MFIPITYPSAKEFWLQNDLPDNSHVASVRQMKSAETSREQLSRFALEHHLQEPVHLMVEDPASRYLFRDGFISHVIPRNVSKGSFVEISQSVFIVNPELCFLLAARHLTIPELVVFATNLCAMYRLDINSELGQMSRVPITSNDKIKKYLQSTKNVSGLTKARAAIKYALNNSNSPMESRIAALGMMSNYRGGYAFPAPVLNYNVKLSSAGQDLLGREYCCCDMVWPERKVVVEYDSSLVHMNQNQFFYDKRKGSALQLSGFLVINVTKEHFRNFQAIEDLFILILKSLGERIPWSQLEKYRAKRANTVPLILGAK